MTFIPPQEPERPIMKIVYDDIPGDRPDNTRTVYYWIENLSDSQRINVQKQRFENHKWVKLSEETAVFPDGWKALSNPKPL
jgi:hypothetical protein